MLKLNWPSAKVPQIARALYQIAAEDEDTVDCCAETGRDS